MQTNTQYHLFTKRLYNLAPVVSFPDLLAKAYLAKTLTLLARPSLEGLVHGLDFC